MSAIHLPGDPARRVPRTHCGKDLTFHRTLDITDDVAEVTCAQCARLYDRDFRRS